MFLFFSLQEIKRFSHETRLPKVRGYYKLIISSGKISDSLFEDLEKHYWREILRVWQMISQGQLYLAEQHAKVLEKQATNFYKELVTLAREWKDPRADEWE